MYSVRGATTIEIDEKTEIINAAEDLISKILEFNCIEKDDIISIVFTCTKDIESAYPGEGARNIGIVHAGILCMQEMHVKNSLEKCIRVLIHVNGEKKQNDVKHIYLKRAVELRPDLKF